MDARPVEHREPTHIHVPRPSRAIGTDREVPVECVSIPDGAGNGAEADAWLVGCGDVSTAD